MANTATSLAEITGTVVHPAYNKMADRLVGFINLNRDKLIKGLGLNELPVIDVLARDDWETERFSTHYDSISNRVIINVNECYYLSFENQYIRRMMSEYVDKIIDDDLGLLVFCLVHELAHHRQHVSGMYKDKSNYQMIDKDSFLDFNNGSLMSYHDLPWETEADTKAIVVICEGNWEYPK